MNDFIIKRNSLIVIFVSIILFIYLYFSYTNNIDEVSTGTNIAYIVLIINIFLAIRSRNNIFLFFIHLAMLYFNYSFMYSNFLNERHFNALTSFADNTIYNTSITITAVFTIVLFIIETIFISKEDVSDIDFQLEDNKRVAISIVLMIAIMSTDLFSFLSFAGQLFEYSVIFIILGVHYSGNNKKLIFMWGAIAIYYFIMGNINGMRVPVLPFIISYVMMTFNRKINWKLLIIGFVIGIVAMTMSGIYGDGNSNVTINDAIEKLRGYGFALDTCVFAHIHSIIMIKVETLVDSAQKLDLFRQFALSQIMGSGMFKFAKLQKFTKQFYMHYDGGILPYYFYFYFKWIGVIAIGIYIGFIMKFISDVKTESKTFLKLCLVFIVSMIPKWYLYEPNQLFRGLFLLGFCYVICEFMEKIFYKNK